MAEQRSSSLERPCHINPNIVDHQALKHSLHNSNQYIVAFRTIEWRKGRNWRWGCRCWVASSRSNCLLRLAATDASPQ
jgi:hypothetical protein